MTVIECKTSSNAGNNISNLSFDFSKSGSLNHSEFISKTTYKRKHWAECRHCRAVLTETALKTLNFCHHLEIRGICFNGQGFDSIPESLGLVLAAAYFGLGQVLVSVSLVLTITLLEGLNHA